jgi:hypothetical protein
MHWERGRAAMPQIDGGGAVGLADRDVQHPSSVEQTFDEVKRVPGLC